MTATLVLTNGRVYTMDRARPRVTAVAVRDDRILAVGSDEEMKALLGAGGEWLDLGGRCVVPGLVDAHVHFHGFSVARKRVDLDNAATLGEVLNRIAAAAEAPPAGPGTEWLRGRGWVQDGWAERRFPTAADLDRIVPDRPACMTHKSGHAVWVNSNALRRAGITPRTPDPPGGQIQRDGAGQPTGIFFEEAIELITRHIPEPSPLEVQQAMREAQAYCWEVGLTGLHDFDGRACFSALQALHLKGELGLRVIKNIPVYRLEHAIGVGLRSGFGDDWLRIGGVKIFADGALGSRTAAMIAPYENDAGNYGIVVTDKEEMMARASEASAHGLSVTVHAIGDRANHDVLDVFTAVRQQEGADRSLRHRIEHVQLLHPDDVNRVAQLGIIASMQPIHATSDMHMADDYWGARSRLAYAARTLLESGASVVFGSDAPVERIDPLPGIHAAVTRRRANGDPGPEGWYPAERLTVQQTIHAFSTAAAQTAGVEDRLGSITPGKLADLTLLERDIFVIPPDELLEAGIAGTIVGGAFRFRTW